MDICFLPSLEHLACAKIVTSLLNDPDVDLCWNTSEEKHNRNALKVKEQISKLLTGYRLKAKLETFITPILCEAENWAKNCSQVVRVIRFPFTLSDAIRQCWLSDGSIDREKSAKILIKRSDISAINRFIFACIFCMFNDALDLWNNLHKIEKVYFRRTYSLTPINSGFIVNQWVEWLDTSTNQDWESFVAWTFQTALWKSNVYIMKRVFQASSPVVRSHYLLEALREEEVSNDVKRFGLTILSRVEREVIFKESLIKVFKCILSWPLRSVFLDLTDNLWPYITTDTFCFILCTILKMVENRERDYIHLLVIIKKFWSQSPSHCKKAAEKDSSISEQLNFVLKYDFSKQVSRQDFLNSFKPKYNRSVVDRIPSFTELLDVYLEDDYLLTDQRLTLHEIFFAG